MASEATLIQLFQNLLANALKYRAEEPPKIHVSATRQGVTLQFGGGPHPQDWYGVLDAVVEGRLDPTPSIGSVIGLDEMPEALDLARRSEGPPRIVVHPNGGTI